MKQRDPYFDIVKAVAISMVVFCHVMSIAPAGTFPIWVNNFRVGMNMPIFFMLSGYFAWPTIEAHNWSKLRYNLQSFLQPTLFAGVFYTAIGLIIGLVDPQPRTVIIRLVRSVFVDPWFITTLIECHLLLFVAFAVGRRVRWALLIIVTVFCIIICRPPFMPGNIHWGCLIGMMPHFAFGAIVLRKLGCRSWENRKVGVFCFIVFISFVLLEGDVEQNGMSFYVADSSIRTFRTVESSICFFLRPIVGLLGSIGVMSLLRIAFDVVPFLGRIAKIGQLTLGIYIFHLWPLGRLRDFALVGRNWWSVTMTSLAMLLVFSFVTWLLMEKTGRFRKWIWSK